MKTIRTALIAVVLVAPYAARADHDHDHDHPKAAKIDNAQYNKIKALAGDWQAAPGSKMPVKITYKVVSNGSAIMETMEPGTDHEMITVYHVNGDKLML